MSDDSIYRPRASFHFMNLPADVQCLILSNVDLHTLKSLIKAIPSARQLYFKYSSSILQGSTALMGLQIRNLLLTVYSLVSTIKSVDTYPTPDLDDMGTFLKQNLDTEKPRRIDLIKSHPLGALQMMCEIDREVVGLARDYANDIYGNACRRDNPGAVLPPLQLSGTEFHRLKRAFYRLKLFGVLFYNYADRFHVDLKASYATFFTRLSLFEIDELVTAYQFALRVRHYFKSPSVHQGCLYSGSKPWTNSDPFNCEICRGLYTIHTGEEVVDSYPWMRRSAQPFWYTVHYDFIHYDGLWAESDLCRPFPIKAWCDMPEANEPSAGWSLWNEYYKCSNRRVSGQTYVNAFRILGYCFWDDKRLRGWGNMFGQAWVSEERRRSYHLWCTICRSQGSMGYCRHP
ncbi:hypothetical protein CC86DRAFT_406425 [Ophiobolus disseminans]|uniref:Uncharacterized protein n=1 Tax=Ophiobolus disseminans TaxID=1469910 RepID=A0A6A6ZZP5_9PLEO|nr:hypothetical protein CC86DRAFT_406425 [Ophiobolus disseminans]